MAAAVCQEAWRAERGSAGWGPLWLPTPSLHQVRAPGGRTFSQKTQDYGSGKTFSFPFSRGHAKTPAKCLSLPVFQPLEEVHRLLIPFHASDPALEKEGTSVGITESFSTVGTVANPRVCSHSS